MATDLRELWRDLRETPVSTHTAHRPLRRLRWAMAGIWLTGLLAWIELQGPPLSLRYMLMWLSLAMLVASIGNPLGWAKSMLFDWCPLYLMLVGYDIARGLVDNLGMRAHVEPHLAFDQALFGDKGATYYLQRGLGSGESAHWYDHLLLVIYLSHFVVSLSVCALLWMRSHQDFLAYRRRIMAVWFSALVVFATYPSVPPWMAAEQGHLPEMQRVMVELLRDLKSGPSGSALAVDDGRISIANEVAAIPSMHAALPLLLLLFVWNRLRFLRVVLAVYTLTMGLTLMYAGEHYLFDILAGWALALSVHAAVCTFEAGRSRVADNLYPEVSAPGERVIIGGEKA